MKGLIFQITSNKKQNTNKHQKTMTKIQDLFILIVLTIVILKL